ncbi:MAG: hypothetical protein H0W84_11650 [Bacteroidetes bacterium]|nr:hypothetical protein [Bacteroidota bacterium]
MNRFLQDFKGLGSTRKVLLILCTAFIAVFFITNIYLNWIYNDRGYHNQHFSELASSMLQGRLYLPDASGHTVDTVLMHGHNYWPLGPFPAVLILPYVAIAEHTTPNVDQAIPQIILVTATFILIFLIARKINYSRISSLYFALAFGAGSMYLPIAFEPSSWYFSHVVATVALLLALFEYYHKKRYWLIGIFLGFSFLTRVPAGVGVVFFALELFSNKQLTWRQKFVFISELGLPLIAALLLQCIYNALRFGNFLESGYGISLLTDPTITANRAYGLFGLIHIPGNLFYMLFQVPIPVFADQVSRVLWFPYIQADLFGMGIFFTSWYLLALFTFSYKDQTSKNLLITIAVITLPIIIYYGIGANQIGYRYGLDFFPFLFLLFMREYRKNHEHLSGRMIVAILASCIFNYYIYYATYYF